MSESVRWLLSKGRFEEAKKILEKAARVNRKTVSMKSMSALMNPVSVKTPSATTQVCVLVIIQNIKEKKQ